jgi:predicted  nucleic acid-binding Zn-ribbon protein
MILSPSQIETSVTRCIFSNISNPINTECPIRLEEFSPTDSVVQIINCGHIFNTRELNTWLLTNNRCPVCRCDILRNPTTNNNVPSTSIRDASNNNTTSIRDASNNNTTSIRDASNNNTNSINLLTQIIDSLFFEYNDNNYDASNNLFTRSNETRFNTRN